MSICKGSICKKVLQITVLTIAMVSILCGCIGGNNVFAPKDKIKTIETIESMTLTLNGMRGTNVYEIEVKNEKTELKLFREVYSNNTSVLELEKSTVVYTDELIELMNTCGVNRWNGFHGKHPKNVLDGIMFEFTATVNGGQTISADGSANFPKGYSEFVRELNSILAESAEAK